MALLSPRSLSWQTILVLIYLATNVKCLPFAWHLRVLYHFIANVSRKPIPPKPFLLPSSIRSSTSTRKILTHPIFTTVQISTRSPLLETDYNLHKSNSTYLTDMDVSRARLVARLVCPAFKQVQLELDAEGYKGSILVALGGVHVTFKREIGIYERFWVRSRVLGWDDKWLVIVSYFVRRKKGGKGEGDKEELCAAGLSKYVLKKGRFTVKPERVLRLAGWLPKEKNSKSAEEEQEMREVNGAIDGAERASELRKNEPASNAAGVEEKRGEGEDDGENGLTAAQIPELAEKVVLDEEAAAAAASSLDALIPSAGGTTVWNPEAWSWEEIEQERLRGLQLAKGWLALDAGLQEEFERV